MEVLIRYFKKCGVDISEHELEILLLELLKEKDPIAGKQNRI